LRQIYLSNSDRFSITILGESHNEFGPCQQLAGGIIVRQNAIHDGVVPGNWILLVSIQSSDGTANPTEMLHLGRIGQIGLGPSFNFFGLNQFRLDIPLNLHR